ncbi:MAG: hypothetical protein IIB63_13010 [Proteobacteria bacterium]|nr:hypothetical protein [Pseudomonadota bacterium]
MWSRALDPGFSFVYTARSGWRRADAAMPGSDFTRIYEFVRGGGEA